MRPQSTVRVRLAIRVVVLVVLTTLIPAVVMPGPANAGGPSAELPQTKSVTVTKPTLNSRPADPAADNALRGDRELPGDKDGSGTNKATSLSPSSTWDVSEQTGDFAVTYPLRVPPAPSGLMPKLALAYRSSAVDGRTSATNNQPSWVGEGWDLSPGFVERAYGGCAEDDGGGTTPPQVGDLCWRSDNATASFDGGGGMLIRDENADPEVWRAKNDNGARIERLLGRNNGDNNGEAWKITTVDGTQYFFGSAQDSSSTWTVPVFGDDADEPCHGSTFEASMCNQAWRWNLDKVVDRNGNMIRYFYEREKNKYGVNLKDAATEYDRGGVLRRIDYGLHQELSASASGRVEFAVADRCLPGGGVCDVENKAHWGNWPDTPLDSRCVAGTCPKQYSPSFWSTKRLAGITTQVLRGSSYSDVDRWELDQQYPDPGDGERAALWLKGIKHTGLVGGSLALPAVRFEGNKFPNRVYTSDGVAPMLKYRLTGILSETGGVTSVNYAEPDCKPASLPENAWTNTKRCFPVTWNKKDHVARTDYFHKYVVASVVQSDRLSTSPAQVTSYEYPDGAAWHWDRSEFTKEDKKTWNEFRGFGRVRVRNGTERDPAGPVTMTDQLFHRGMDGDRLNRDGGAKPVVLTDSEGTARTDHDRLIGIGYESRMFERSKPAGSAEPDPPLVGKSITDMWSKGPTAKRGVFEAYIIRPSAQRQFTALKSGGWRESKAETSYDDFGLPVNANDLGDVSKADDDQCTTTRYARNFGPWLLNLVSTVETVSVSCSATPVFPRDAVSDRKTSYDGLAVGAPPVRGNPTKIEVGKERTAGNPVYVTESQARHDIHGRVIEGTDAAGSVTRTKFTPLTGGPVTKIEATSPRTSVAPLGMVTTTLLEPASGQATLITDANSRTTETAYDALGRKTEVWLANRPRATNTQGNFKFSYLIRDDKPTVVTSSKIGPNGMYTTNKTLLDGLLRPRQSQSAAVGGGRLLTDTKYDTQGRVYKATQPYFNNAPVDDELWEAFDSEVPGLTRSEYDGAGRQIASVYQAGAVDKWRTTTEYGGDRVSVTPPAGGTATTTISDARGRTTELRQYHGPKPAGDHDSTSYKYDRAGYLSEVVAPGNAVWRFGYDLRGNKIRTQDPDSGVSTMTYDDAGRVATATDARGSTLAYAYDSLSRKTATHSGSLSGAKLAEWVYDTAGGGQGQLAASTRFVTVGTERHAYTTSVGSYTELYQPNDSTLTIPAAEGPLAGRYTWYGGYNWDGSLSGETYPKAGDLDHEDVNYVHHDTGRLLSSSGNYQDNAVELVSETLYTRYGEAERIQFGTGTKRAWLSNYYDPSTRRVERSIVDAEVPAPMQSDVHYKYDDAGFTTSITEAAPGQLDTQCFEHDYLGRMTEAWTPTGACAEPSAPELGGAAPYWHSYAYDKTGNRKEETQHSTAGDKVRRFEHPDPAAPHRLKTVTGGVAPETYEYDAAGNTTSRTQAGVAETLKWTAEGNLESVTKGGNTTSFIYTAEGSRLLRKDSGGTTLYMGNQEVRLSASGGSPVTTRYYNYGDSVVAVRVGAKLTWMLGDQRATQVAIDSETMQVTRRRQLPFGAPRGTAPPSWPSERSFVGGTLDPSTNLTHLGAREYDTNTGRFMSVDPILDPTDPQQMNGYAYGNNNPSTFQDASGLRSCGIDGAGCGQQRETENALTGGTGVVAPPSQPGPKQSGPGPIVVQGTGAGGMDEARGQAHDIGVRAKRAGFRTQYTYVNVMVQVPSGVQGPGAEYVLVPGVIIAMSFSRLPQCTDPNGNNPDGVFKPSPLTRAEQAAYDRANPQPPPSRAPMSAAQFLAELTGADKVADCIMAPSVGGCLEAAIPFAVGPLGKAAAAGGHALVGGSKAASVLGKACSFDGDTEVLMADGATEPISEIQVGDQVLATDPETGERGARTVTAVMVHDDTVLELAAEDGATVTTTEDHPFYNATDRAWERADQLDPGDRLLTADGRLVAVSGLGVGSARVAAAYNLTVTGLHTYFVMAGNAPVLVHNSCPVLHRLKPRMEDGNSRHGWIHITQRHMPGGANPGQEQGSLFAPGTTRDQVSAAAEELVRRGTRQSDPGQQLQVFEGRMNINGLRTNYRLLVDSADGNRIHTMFPIG
ncbi:MAG: polymorphic toxin-type HINT domain-containing protein [Kibdelosporangium sp.]